MFIMSRIMRVQFMSNWECWNAYLNIKFMNTYIHIYKKVYECMNTYKYTLYIKTWIKYIIKHPYIHLT